MQSELSTDALTRYAQLRDNPWLFLKYCTYTQDEVDTDNPIKLFPSHLLYLQFLTIMWQKNKRLAIPKSRRMTASWTFIGLMLWDCIFHRGRSWAAVSKKEEDSKELVQRAEFIYKHIPHEILAPELLPKLKRGEMQSSPPVMDFFEVNSKIQGFPSGANQLRQRGFSGILNDECAFWEDAEASYASAEPTIKGGGRMIMISSRATEDGGFFKKIVFDQLDSENSRFPEIAPVKTKSPIEGVTTWINPKNQFCIIDLHYTANPAKRGEEFREGLKATLPIRRYRMEYEKSWETFDGKPVYEDFNERIHLTQIKPKIAVGLPILIGWDSSGLTPAAVLAQLQEDRLIVFREIISPGMGAQRFVPHVVSEILLNYPQFTDIEKQTISFFDPAGFRKNEITEETYLDEMRKHGFRQIRPGPVSWLKRVESVNNYLLKLVKGQPSLLLYEQDCPVLTAGFKGGFRYPDAVNEKEPDKVRPLKDIHSHPHDGLQYLCGGLRSYRAENYNAPIIEAPTYGFQKHQPVRSTERPTLRKRYGTTDR